jgi:hypothetical protein
MSLLKVVQTPIEPRADEASPPEKRKKEVAETGGIVFSDGRSLELIRDRAGRLALLDSARKRGAQRIRYKGRTYVPPTVDASLSEALTLPTGRATGSTTDIIKNICTTFAQYGLSDQTAIKLTYWRLSTWFADLFPLAPCLSITGPMLEAILVLQLLACVVRHGLLLADINLSRFLSLPTHVQPTLLIGRSSSAVRNVLSASNYRRAYVPNRDGVTDLHCAKAVYAGAHVKDDAPDGAFHVHLTSIDGKLPVISDLAVQKLAGDFQPLLLDYRMRNAAQVRDSNFDIPALPSELRLLVRVLGSAIVDAPELQADLAKLLQAYKDDIRLGDAYNEQHIVIEALLNHGHSEQADQLLYVGQLTDTANNILKDRGSREKLSPKALGWMLRSLLGFTPRRNGKGFAIKLTGEVLLRIHRLAREFQVLATNETARACSQCAEIDGEMGCSNSEPTDMSPT